MKNKITLLFVLFVSFVVNCPAQTSTNKSFMLNNGTGGTTDNYLPPNETNFFDQNYIWLAGALTRGGFSSGGSGGGVASILSLTGTIGFTTFSNALGLGGAAGQPISAFVAGPLQVTTNNIPLMVTNDNAGDVDLNGGLHVIGAATLSAGITVGTTGDFFGTVQGGSFFTLGAPGYTGDGSGLINLNGSEINSGTVPYANLPATIQTASSQTLSNLQATSTINAAGQFTNSPLVIFTNTFLSATILSNRFLLQSTNGVILSFDLTNGLSLSNILGGAQTQTFQVGTNGNVLIPIGSLTAEHSAVILSSSGVGLSVTGAMNSSDIADFISPSGPTKLVYVDGSGDMVVSNGGIVISGGFTNLAKNFGADTSGKVTGVQFVGGGAGLTSLNASQITSGTLPSAQLPTASTTAAGAVKIDGVSLTFNGSGQLQSSGGGGSFSGNGLQFHTSGTTSIPQYAPMTNVEFYSTNSPGHGTNEAAVVASVTEGAGYCYVGVGDEQQNLFSVDYFGNINCAGSITPVDGFDGDGGGITGLNATQLTSGVIPLGTLPGTLPLVSTNNGVLLTNIQSTNITGPYFTNIQVEADLLTTNLTQWVVKGNSVWSIASSNILLATGNSGDSYGDYLVNTNFGDPFHWTTLKFTLRILQTNAVAEIGFGTFSEAAYVPSNLVFAISINPSSGNGTMFAWYGGTTTPNDPSVVASSPTPVFGGYFATNQPWGITLTRRDEQYSINISNQTTGAQWNWKYCYQTASLIAGYEPAGWGYPCLWSSGALTANFANWTMTADTFWPVKFLAFGDSKTSGYGNVDPETQWTRRLARAYGPGVCIDAAGNATSQDATNWVLAKILRPQIAVLDIGVNDLALGLSAAQTEANITNFWGLNSNYCGKFYAVMPEPYNASSAAFDTFVSTNYAPTNVLDFDSPLATYGSWVLTNTLSMDGLHPNGAGNGILFNVVNNKINNFQP